MYSHVSERSGLRAPLIADDVYEIIMKVFPLSVDIGPDMIILCINMVEDLKLKLKFLYSLLKLVYEYIIELLHS